MNIVLTGATGFIGRRLIERLHLDNHSVRALGRHNPHITGVEFFPWTSAQEPPDAAFRDVDAVVHLAGEPVAQRWSEEVKRRIHSSRVTGTKNLVNGLLKLNTRPAAFIAASAVGYYGDRGELILNEASGPGKDFLARVCVEWEREARRAGELGVRVAMLRIGMVLGKGGGALQQMSGPFKAGFGGPIGSGKQWSSWIHLDDVVGLIAYGLQSDRVYGAVNATSPRPVRNAEFAKELGAALGRPAVVPVPAFGLKLLYGEMSTVILASQRAIPEAATRAGYRFLFPELRDALRQVFTAT